VTSSEAAALWEAVAELRDELHDLAARVDHVHREALRVLTQQTGARTNADTRPEPDRAG
jgi:hypothetical protein